MKKQLIPFLLSTLFFTLSSCNDDSCEDVTCGFGFTCDDGECVLRDVPKGMKISEILLKQWPANKNGESWDSQNDNPDIALVITDISGNLILKTRVINNVNQNAFYSWNFPDPLTLNPSNRYHFNLVDDDAGNNFELMFHILTQLLDDNTAPKFPYVFKHSSVEMEFETTYVY